MSFYTKDLSIWILVTVGVLERRDDHTVGKENMEWSLGVSALWVYASFAW